MAPRITKVVPEIAPTLTPAVYMPYTPEEDLPYSPNPKGVDVYFLDAAKAALGREGYIAYLRGTIMWYTWLSGQCPESQPDSFGAECATRTAYLSTVLAEALGE